MNEFDLNVLRQRVRDLMGQLAHVQRLLEDEPDDPRLHRARAKVESQIDVARGELRIASGLTPLDLTGRTPCESCE